MNTSNRASITAILLAIGLSAQAQEMGAMDFAAAAGASTSGYSKAMIGTSYGTTPYQTHYEISDLLDAVVADIAQQLESFLTLALHSEAEKVADERAAEPEIVSAQ